MCLGSLGVKREKELGVISRDAIRGNGDETVRKRRDEYHYLVNEIKQAIKPSAVRN